MNKLSILKITSASFSWMVLYAKRILELSIIPILLMLPFIFSFTHLMTIIQSQPLNALKTTQLSIPSALLFYLLLALYAYVLLSINIHRLVILGENSIARFGVWLPDMRLGHFFLILVLVQILLVLPILITKLPILYFVVYYLIAPMMMKLVGIAIEAENRPYPMNYSVRFSFVTLQAILPMFVMLPFVLLTQNTPIFIMMIVIKIIITYWMLISLSLIYKQLDYRHKY